MSYMRRSAQKRSDLDQVLPGVKAVICLRTNYLTAEKDMTFVDDPDRGDISLYALNDDYHDVLVKRHRALEDKIQEEFPGCKTKSYIDTGPVLEKPLAQKAGLGWVGKHTNLITEDAGSYYFLSEILLDIALVEWEPAVDRCGTCRSCIDVCPTAAIVAPYVLDSRKCISYLTIELKGVIPREYRKAIGNRIYGCDDCQVVCPWNSFAIKTEDEAFRERDGTRQLIELMRLDDEGFRQRFRKSPIKRTKRRGLLRNVAVALGNSGNPDAVGPLTDALSDPEPLIRAHTVWALGELLGEKVLPILDDKLTGETEEIVRTEVRHLPWG
jgi:epoxyqueuosine reductase